MKQPIYLDYNATAPVLPEVKQAVLDAMDCTGNPSSVHSAGRQAKKIIEDARVKVAALVGARARDVVFTSGGTEANNLVLKGTPAASIITSTIEHDCILAGAKSSGKPVYLVPVTNSGVVDLISLAEILAKAEKPALVSIMLANNEMGAIQPMTEVSQISKEYGAFVHTDAVQAAGKMNIDRDALGVDYLTLSGHKFGGPKGVGALILTPTAPLSAEIVGGGQELGRRSGTENVASIAGFGVAAIAAFDNITQMERIEKMRDHLEIAISQKADDAIVVGKACPDRLANTSCIIMPHTSGETQVMHMDLNNICISSGSACSSGKVKVSHVMTALGFDANKASNSIRISLGLGTTETDIEQFLSAWFDLYDRTQKRHASEIKAES